MLALTHTALLKSTVTLRALELHGSRCRVVKLCYGNNSSCSRNGTSSPSSCSSACWSQNSEAKLVHLNLCQSEWRQVKPYCNKINRNRSFCEVRAGICDFRPTSESHLLSVCCLILTSQRIFWKVHACLDFLVGVVYGGTTKSQKITHEGKHVASVSRGLLN